MKKLYQKNIAIACIFIAAMVTGCGSTKNQPTGFAKKQWQAIGKADSFPLLPAPVPMPVAPEPLPVASVAMGDTANLDEIKTDFPMATGPFQPTWNSISDNYPGYPAWLREAKFGIWIHFGPQAAGMSGDWYARRMYMQGDEAYDNHIKKYGHPSDSGYKEVLRSWNPTKLDPAWYVNLYHKIGARFLMIQGVHHDNYDLWDSKYQPWNSVNIGPHKDLMGEWALAVKKAGMHYGVAFHHEYTWWWWQTAYRSDKTGPKAGVPYDGHLTLEDGKGKWWEGYDPKLLYGINMREYKGMDEFKYNLPKGIFSNHLNYGKWYVDRWALRMLDVIGKYDPDFIYTDGNSTQAFSGWNSGTGYKCDADQRVIASFFNRALTKHGKADVFSITKFHPAGRNGIVTTFEANYPREIKTDQAWIAENAVGDWYYRPGFTYTADGVIRFLLEAVSRDGCYAVNIPIMPDGSLEPECLTMLYQIGDWMAINGPAIYGSKAWLVAGEGKNGQIRYLPGGQIGKEHAAFQFGQEDFRFTVGKDGSLFAFCMMVPPTGTTLKITALAIGGKTTLPVKKVELLGYKGVLSWQQTAEGLLVILPNTTVFKTAICLKIN